METYVNNNANRASDSDSAQVSVCMCVEAPKCLSVSVFECLCV